MGRRYVLVDDYDGKELDSDTKPTRVSIGRKAWNLYLSDDNLGKLYEALEPFTKDAEQDSGSQSAPKPTSDRARTRAIREWAQAQGIKQPNGKPLGDRGRIPKEIEDAYDEAH